MRGRCCRLHAWGTLLCAASALSPPLSSLRRLRQSLRCLWRWAPGAAHAKGRRRPPLACRHPRSSLLVPQRAQAILAVAWSSHNRLCHASLCVVRLETPLAQAVPGPLDRWAMCRWATPSAAAQPLPPRWTRGPRLLAASHGPEPCRQCPKVAHPPVHQQQRSLNPHRAATRTTRGRRTCWMKGTPRVHQRDEKGATRTPSPRPRRPRRPPRPFPCAGPAAPAGPSPCHRCSPLPLAFGAQKAPLLPER